MQLFGVMNFTFFFDKVSKAWTSQLWCCVSYCITALVFTLLNALLYCSNMIQKQKISGVYVIPSAKSALGRFSVW